MRIAIMSEMLNKFLLSLIKMRQGNVDAKIFLFC